jgi:hypothetical protein
MLLILNNQILNTNQTINLFKNNLTYSIVCSSLNSNPNVNLELYDSSSLLSLATSTNSIVKNSCDQTNLCTNILQVNFKFMDNRFDNMTSFTCSANSSDPKVPLFTSIRQNVTVSTPRKHFFLSQSILIN